MSEQMTDEEIDRMIHLLKRFAAEELDQWVMWRTETDHGPVFISISRKPEQGASEHAYDPI